MYPTSRTSFFQGTPPKKTTLAPITPTSNSHRFQKVCRKLRRLTEANFERGSRSRENLKVVETLEHFFRSPPLAAITHQSRGHMCSPWL